MLPLIAARCAGGWLLLAAIPLVAGCSLLPGKQLAACREEKRELLARIQHDQDRLQVALAGEREANQRLAQAEKQLALVYGRLSNPAQVAGHPARNDEPDGASAASEPLVSEPLPSAPSAPRDEPPAVPHTASSDDGWSVRPPASGEATQSR